VCVGLIQEDNESHYHLGLAQGTQIAQSQAERDWKGFPIRELAQFIASVYILVKVLYLNAKYPFLQSTAWDLEYK